MINKQIIQSTFLNPQTIIDYNIFFTDSKLLSLSKSAFRSLRSEVLELVSRWELLSETKPKQLTGGM